MSKERKIELVSERVLRITELWGSLVDTAYFEIPETSALNALDLEKICHVSNKPILTGDFLKEHGAYLQNFTQDGVVIPAHEMVTRDSAMTYVRKYFDKGVLNDPGNGEAADILYRLGTTVMHARSHYQNGLLHNPAPDIAAIMTFDGKTQATRSTSFYEFGKSHDPAENKPAYEEFWSDTGHLVARKFYKEGQLHDPVSAEAAYQRYCSKTGALLEQWHYKHGIQFN